MNAILGMAGMLQETELTEEQLRFVQVLYNAGENLLAIINDILDISKIEANRIELETVSFSLQEIIEGICDIMAIRAHEKGLELNFWISPKVPPAVCGDPVRIRQVLINLLGNAVKFTEKGEVLLKVEKPATGAARQGKEKHLLIPFSVSDTGIGIPSKKIGVIFESFSQLDSSTTRKYGGTGLGLAISRKLVKMMGGSLEVKSRRGKGSVFSFSLPLKAGAPEKKETPDTAEDLSGRHVLVVEDIDTTRLILRRLLTRWGMAVFEIPSGRRALAAFRNARKEGRPFDIVLIDSEIPETDGFSVVEGIRSAPGLPPATIMMVTSTNQMEDTRRARSLGVDNILVKPVKKVELETALRKSLDRRSASKTPQAPEPSPPANVPAVVRKILLVDDSADNRLLAHYLSGKSGPPCCGGGERAAGRGIVRSGHL